MKLLKDYDYTIEHYLGRANVMTNVVSRKAMGSLAYVRTIYYPLLVALRDMKVRLEMGLHQVREV